MYGISDWMIIIVETLQDGKKKNILPRTTVMVRANAVAQMYVTASLISIHYLQDKIRSDYASKNEDRCLSVLNPMKFEMKATESFRCLLQRIRYLMLVGYNRNIAKYEDLIRSHREKRNQENWNFISYFLVQEQLATVLSSLGCGLNLEALIQYDELDAMLSQFVLNSVIGEKPRWFKVFEEAPQSFEGINLDPKSLLETRKKIEARSVNLLQFRSYIFARQCVLLQSDRPWEIAKRLLPFLFSTIREIETLKVDMPNGALCCWQFICAMEVLKICDQISETGDNNECFQYCADIWNLAKDKLYELGKLCGLLPGCKPSSEHLHSVVLLSAGIGDTVTVGDLEALVERPYSLQTTDRSSSRSPSPARVKKPPTERLKEALGSSQAFETLYKELCELAISTYKHISRLRSARLVGMDLGHLYFSLNEPQQAIVFFNDQMRELRAEQWNFLASQSLLELASCYKKMDNVLGYTKTCGAISCSVELEILLRYFYFEEYLKCIKQLKSNPGTISEGLPHVCPLEDHFKVHDVRILSEAIIIQDHEISVELSVESHFPREIFADKIQLAFETEAAVNPEDSVPESKQLIGSKLPLKLHLEFKQDNSLDCSAMILESKRQPVRRTSSTKRKATVTSRGDFSNSVQNGNLSIKPGLNTIVLSTKATRVGSWTFRQLSVVYENMDFLSDSLPKGKSFEIVNKPAAASLAFDMLYAGFEQSCRLAVSAGSFVFPRESPILVKGTERLKFKLDGSDEEFKKDLSVVLKDMKQFEEREIALKCLCDLPGRRENKPIEHSVELSVPWTRTNINIPLSFSPALTANCRLHTAGIKKFLQVIVHGMVDERIVLSDAKMRCKEGGIEIRDLNPPGPVVIYKDLTVSYLFEIQIEPLMTETELPLIQINFTVQYANEDQPTLKRPYSCKFDVTDYATIYRIQAKIEPSELCRVSSACTLSLRISKVLDNPHKDLMYEVLADQNMWAVCGRSSGVVSMGDVQHQTITVEVLPLTAGFLALPSIRIMKYVQGSRLDSGVPKLEQFPPGQIYNATKSMQIHVLSSN